MEVSVLPWKKCVGQWDRVRSIENISEPEVWNVCEIGSSPAAFILEKERKSKVGSMANI